MTEEEQKLEKNYNQEIVFDTHKYKKVLRSDRKIKIKLDSPEIQNQIQDQIS